MKSRPKYSLNVTSKYSNPNLQSRLADTLLEARKNRLSTGIKTPNRRKLTSEKSPPNREA